MNIRKLSELILDYTFPPSLYCICCGNIIDETRTYNLCDHCMEHMEWNFDEADFAKELQILKCVEYGIYGRTLIFSLKYKNKKYIARDIGKIMADRLAFSHVDFDLIVPVPLSPAKKSARGFNQSFLIGKYLSKETGKPVIENLLYRNRDTLPMRGLSPEERRQNIKGAISLDEKTFRKYKAGISGKKILLVDDIYTTGSTAAECARALNLTEPEAVIFLAFAGRDFA
ncbi:MAG: hypothetical protein SOR72_05370 [Hornefia sp.]|nr:hypothetical protein [Hornefia sp.]